MKRKKIIHTFFSDEEYKKIKEYSKKKGFSMGGFLRIISLCEVDKNDRPE